MGKKKRHGQSAFRGRRPTLGLVMMVRDEEAVLGRSLDSVAGVVDVVIIVDTGSTDRTKEIAASYAGRMFRAVSASQGFGVAFKLLDFPWGDDFSAPRNAGLEAASTDWILWLDADEELSSGKDLLPGLISNPKTLAYFCRIDVPSISGGGGGDHASFAAPRLFRRRRDIRFKYPIHEQLTLPEDPALCKYCDLTIVHFGPSLDGDTAISVRRQRNLALLKKAISQNPGEPYFHSKLAGEYFNSGEFRSAYQEYSKVVELEDDPYLQYVPPVRRNMAACLHEMGDTAGALALLEESQSMYPSYTDLFFLEGELAAAAGNMPRALAAYRRCLEMGDPPPGYATWGGTGSWLARQRLHELGSTVNDGRSSGKVDAL